MIEAAVFFGAVIIGVTRFIKLLAPNVNGALTIAVSVGLGLLLAVIDTEIGVVDISIAEGILLGFGSSGVVNVAEKV